MSAHAEGPVLLYDGFCGFCDRTVQFILARDTRGEIRFAPLQGTFAEGVFARHPEIRNVDSLVLVQQKGGEESVLVQWHAVIAILAHIGGTWNALAILMRMIPAFIGDGVYAAFAKIRYRVFGKFDACPVPTPAQRGRFIE